MLRSGREGGRGRFFEKKRRKKLLLPKALALPRPEAQLKKVFARFFQKAPLP
jgi:hypothetical protein